jgi:large subunit ribosomal protein L4e
MFAPLRTFRRWHRKINLNQKRNAVAAAIAASAIVPLVQARGHAINRIPELPLVFTDKVESYEKTKEAINFFKRAEAYEDLKLVSQTQNNHSGKAKCRGKYVHTRRGPLIVYGNENIKLLQAVRNL